MTSTTSLARNPVFYLGLVAIIVLVITVQLAAFLQFQHLFGAAPTPEAISVNTLINYGNGTSRWENLTDVLSGWSFYQLTTTIAQTEATPTSSVSGQHLITGLDGVRSSGAHYWTLWVFCSKDFAWAASRVGADLIKLKNGDILAWYYQAPRSINPADWDPPVAFAPNISACSG